MKRIDCLHITSDIDKPSQYGVLPYFTKKLHEALLEVGIESRLWHVNKDTPEKFIKEISADPPLCTISFNYVVTNDFHVPHLTVLVDAPYYFFNWMAIPNMLWSCADRIDTEIYRRLGFNHMFFMPHATDKTEVLEVEKKYDVVMMSTFIDYEANRNQWKERYSQELCHIMNDAVTSILNQPRLASYEAFIEALDRHTDKEGLLNKVSIVDVFHDIDLYVRGVDRVELVRSIKNARIDIFGASNGQGWAKCIDQPNVTIHPELPFTEALKVIAQSKVILNSCPTIKDGAHERVFTAMANQALVVSTESRYLREQFPEDTMIFYDGTNRETIGPLIDRHLQNPEIRQASIEMARQITLERHTWKERAKQMIIDLIPILEKIKT
jgi:hypothetical protein